MEVITRSDSDNEDYLKRERAVKLTYSQIRELLQRNVTKNITRKYVQYTKDMLKRYIQNPDKNIDTLREISRFLERNSMIYRKLLMYYASMPLFYYNITQINNLTEEINRIQSIQEYENILKQFESFDIKSVGYNSIYNTVRDGMYVGYCSTKKNSGMIILPLDIKYIRIRGKVGEFGEKEQWVICMDASFFDSTVNRDFIEEDIGQWDKIFIDAYEEYQKDKRNKRWFELPPEKTFCMLTSTNDDFSTPLPFFLPLFCSILDLLDLQEILQSKTELENYKLIISQIPLMDNTDQVDDFAVSLELLKEFDKQIEEATPELVGAASTPCKVDTIEFNSNSSDNTDELAESIQNLFQNAGASQLVVSGGSSSNSVGLKHAIKNDQATTWFFVNQFETWLNYFIHKNIAKNYRLSIHRITWYNEDEYAQKMKDYATLGSSALDFLTAKGDTPYEAYQKIRFENAIGIKDIMIPLYSSYNTSDRTVGQPEKKEDDLSAEGLKTRDGDKNAGTKANG